MILQIQHLLQYLPLGELPWTDLSLPDRKPSTLEVTEHGGKVEDHTELCTRIQSNCKVLHIIRKFCDPIQIKTKLKR